MKVMPNFVINRFALGTSLMVLSALLLLGCGGGGGAINAIQPPPGEVASVTVTPATASIGVGKTQQFAAVAKDSSGNVIVGTTFTWSSDTTSTATVNSSGLATAVALGTAHITATASGVNGSATLTVNPAISSVSVSPLTATINAGQTQQFTAVAKDSQGNVISGVTFTWNSDASSIATVNSSGLASGLSQGTAHISATASGVAGSGILTVNPAVISGNAIPASFYGFTINDPCSISNTRPDGSDCSNTESHSFPGLPLTWSRSLGESYIKWSDIVQCDPTGSVCPLPGSGCSKDGLGSGGAPCADSELVTGCVPNAKDPGDPTNCAYVWVTFDFFANQLNSHSVDFMYDAYYTPDYLSVRGSRCTANGQADFGPDATCVGAIDSCGGGVNFNWGCDPPADIDATPGSGLADGTDQNFKSFVNAFMTHLQQSSEHIKYWEVWNEPNVCKEWNHGDENGIDCTSQNPGGGPSVGTAKQLVRMAQDARTIIPMFDSTVLISSPALVGLQGSNTAAYMNKILTLGGSTLFDLIGFHGYYAEANGSCPSNCPVPENWLEQWNNVVSVMNATGQSSKPAINTEYSWGAHTDVTDPDMRAAQAARLFLLQESYYPALVRENWYGEDFVIQPDGGSGQFWASGENNVADNCSVVDPVQGGFRCPAGLAMDQVYQWTLGATFGGACTCSGSNCAEVPPTPPVGIFQCSITRSGGYAGLFVWDSSATTFPCSNTPCGTTTFTIPAGYTSDWQDLDGNVTQLGGAKSVTIGAKPILIETVP
jgi:Bacterial Ig-like domain (group 2)